MLKTTDSGTALLNLEYSDYTGKSVPERVPVSTCHNILLCELLEQGESRDIVETPWGKLSTNQQILLPNPQGPEIGVPNLPF